MPIDSSIYSQVQQPQQANPLNALAQAYQIKGLQSQMDRGDREAAQQNRLLELVQSPSFANLPTAQKASALQGIGAFDKAGTLVTTEAAANKDQRAAAVSDFDMKVKQLDAAANIAATVKDQDSYSRAIPMIQGLGIDVSKFNPTYDAAGVAQFAQATLSAKDRLNAQIQQQGQQITRQNNIDTNATSRANNADTVANSAQTAQMTDARSREFNATRVEENKIKRDQQGTGVKLTEDQGKATGWLVQAENAFKNMQSAGFDKDGNPTSAAKPGFNDALERLPVVGGAANALRSPERQKFMQASSSLSESLLRAATGAGVNESEAKQKIQELTPRFGEDNETTKQKMAAIPLYIESLKVRAGPGAAKATEIGGKAADSAAPVKSKVIGGKTYANDGKGWYVVN